MSRARAERRSGRLAKSVGRFLQAFSRIAKEQRAACQNACASTRPWWDRRAPRRPAAVPAGARAHQGGAPRLVRGAGLHRGRDERACRSRPATRRTCTPSRPSWSAPTSARAAALPAHLAGVRLQEAAGGGRGAGSSPSRPCSATASAAPCTARVHHARVVSRRASPTSGDGRLRGAPEARGRDADNRFVSLRRGVTADPRAEPERLTVAEAFAATPASICWPASAAAATIATRSPPWRGAGIRVAADDTWSDIFSRVLVALIEPKLGNGRATLLTEYPAQPGRAGAAASRTTRASPSASSSTAAGSSSPTASAS